MQSESIKSPVCVLFIHSDLRTMFDYIFTRQWTYVHSPFEHIYIFL